MLAKYSTIASYHDCCVVQCSGEAATLAKYLKKLNLMMQSALKKFPSATWFACLPQIVSRIGHSNSDVVNIIKEIISKVLIAFPEQVCRYIIMQSLSNDCCTQGLWFIACLKNSLSPDRRVQGEAILNVAVRELHRHKRSASAQMLSESARLFDDLVRVANHQSSSRRVKLPIGTQCQLEKFLVPIQAALKISYPPLAGRGQCMGGGGGEVSAAEETSGDVVYFPSDQVHCVLSQ